MNHILPTEPARSLCLEMIKNIRSTGYLDYDGERLIKEESLFNNEIGGLMLGILTTTDGTVYKAFSGIIDKRFELKPFVPQLFDSTLYQETIKDLDLQIHQVTKEIEKKPSKELIEKRKALSNECWKKIAHLYHFHCADGKVRGFEDTIGIYCPSGSGDCCAPKLLNACYKDKKIPASLEEFFYGKGTRESGNFYGPCDQKCKKLLEHQIGLNIVYCDSDIVVVNKQAGILSIEGKGPEKQDCIASRVRRFYSPCIKQPCIHRLDQATSGLMVLGLTDFAHNTLSKDFENRKVKKTYMALVDGVIKETEGIIDMPMRLDVDNRPHQIIDTIQGKKAITHFSRVSIQKYKDGYATRLLLSPETGRTHQLRVHCAYCLQHPILGDDLYGDGTSAPRLFLQANHLEFSHPVTRQWMVFDLEREF